MTSLLSDWMDRALTRAVLDVERLAARRSWRLARWARRGGAAIHETALRASHGLGVAGVSSAETAAMQAREPKALPPCPRLLGPGTEVGPGVDALLEESWLLEDGTAVRFDQLSWCRDPFGVGPSVPRFHFHCLEWVRQLVEAHEVTRERTYLVRARELAERWMGECLHLERHEKIWDDHITAMRAAILCRLWTACRLDEASGSRFMRDLLGALLRHAGKLSVEAFYRPAHNHGVTQAYALMVIGLLLPLHPHAGRWVEQGQARLEAQAWENVSPEGAHREHSPYYHFFVLRHFLDAQGLAEAHGLSFSPGFADRVRSMLEMGARMLKPDGSLAAMGDTSRNSPVLVGLDAIEALGGAGADALRHALTRGARGRPPQERSVHAARGGYAFLRSGWGETEPPADERYLAMRTAVFATSHVHRDALSFELYGYGRDLIVDSGGPFGYGHPLRQRFFLSARAHNTVVVDDGEQMLGPTRLLRWAPGADHDVLMAEHETAPGVWHRRAVLFVRGRYVVVLDRVEALDGEHRYVDLFHLDPALEARIDGRTVVTESRSGATLALHALLGDGASIALARGAEAPPQGWVSTGDRQKTANTVVAFEQSGPHAVFATLLLPEPAGRRAAVRAHLDGAPLAGDCRIHVSLDTHHDELAFSREGELTVRSS